jgi:hypothetical protein
MTITEALNEFRHSQMAKFMSHHNKMQARGQATFSALIVDSADHMQLDNIVKHLWEEISELVDSNYNDPLECVDVANLAFMLWWKLTESQQKIDALTGV